MLKDKIKSLINIIEGTEINELEVSSFWGAQKIRLQKNINTLVQTFPTSTAVNEEQITPEAVSPVIESVSADTPTVSTTEQDSQVPASNALEVIAPLVGTFYQSAKPGTPPFVKEGDLIEVGQIICIIEAMKIFNEIEAEVSGRIVKIIVNDSSPVEYGQVLMLIEAS